jgi:hypothetical protein
MTVLLKDHPMATKNSGGRPPKPGGEGKMVRLDPKLVAMARIVAADRDVSMGEYIGGIAFETIRRDYLATMRKVEKEVGMDREEGGAKKGGK